MIDGTQDAVTIGDLVHRHRAGTGSIYARAGPHRRRWFPSPAPSRLTTAGPAELRDQVLPLMASARMQAAERFAFPSGSEHAADRLSTTLIPSLTLCPPWGLHVPTPDVPHAKNRLVHAPCLLDLCIGDAVISGHVVHGHHGATAWVLGLAALWYWCTGSLYLC
jgi:hypothetical protein